MQVILNVSMPSCIKQGVQYCSTPEGFMSIKQMHPEDEFIIQDEESYDAWMDYRTELAMKEVYDFCDGMGITLSDFSALLTWHSVKDLLLAPLYEAEDEYARLASEYNDANWYEFHNYAVYMGWV